MKRRNFLQMLWCCCSALLPITLQAKPEIVVDYRGRWHGGMEERLRYGHVFVNGKEIRQVFYVDTGRGLVMTYDVLEDNKVHLARSFPHGTFPTVGGGIAYKEISGQIQLFTRDGERIA